ncbi:MAG: hypothetical protein AAB227_06775 [Pseudomonadota bacterium]
MRNFLKLGGAAAGGLFLASCVTYPYQSAFSSCDSEASACYRLCEDIPDEDGYVACQSHCDRDSDRCFDQAYSPYSSGYGYGGGYGYSSPWYGQYGSWYPGGGYYMSYNYYDRYGYRKKRHHPHPNDGGWNGGGNNHPPSSTPPPDSNPRIPRGEREIDQPRRPNRYYRRDVPNNAAPSGSPSATPAPQPRYAPPPREPRRVTPSAPQPSYTPPPQPTYTPPLQQPSYTPPPASQPQSRPVDRGGSGRRVNSPRESSEGSRQPD